MTFYSSSSSLKLSFSSFPRHTSKETETGQAKRKRDRDRDRDSDRDRDREKVKMETETQNCLLLSVIFLCSGFVVISLFWSNDRVITCHHFQTCRPSRKNLQSSHCRNLLTYQSCHNRFPSLPAGLRRRNLKTFPRVLK